MASRASWCEPPSCGPRDGETPGHGLRHHRTSSGRRRRPSTIPRRRSARPARAARDSIVSGMRHVQLVSATVPGTLMRSARGIRRPELPVQVEQLLELEYAQARSRPEAARDDGRVCLRRQALGARPVETQQREVRLPLGPVLLPPPAQRRGVVHGRGGDRERGIRGGIDERAAGPLPFPCPALDAEAEDAEVGEHAGHAVGHVAEVLRAHEHVARAAHHGEEVPSAPFPRALARCPALAEQVLQPAPTVFAERGERLRPLVVPGREEAVAARGEQRPIRVPPVERLADRLGARRGRGSRPPDRARRAGGRGLPHRCAAGSGRLPARRSGPSRARRSSPRTWGTESQRTAASSKPAAARSARVHASAGSNQPSRPLDSVAGTCQMRKNPST